MAAPRHNVADFFCPCDDFMQFQDALKLLRVNDDKIRHQLNAIIPTQSFAQKVNTTDQCKALYERMTELYDGREKAIQHCIGQTTEELEHWQQRRLKDRDDVEAADMLRKSSKKLHLMKRELVIEKVTRDSSFKTFYERCRNAYVPPHRALV